MTGMSSTALSFRLPAWLRPAEDSLAAHMRRSGHRPGLYALNLLWALWLFAAPLFTPVGPGFVWSLVVGCPLLLLLYAMLYVRPYAETGIYVGLLTMLAVFSMPFNPTAWTYGVFACVHVPYQPSQSLKRPLFLMSLVVLSQVVAAWWLQWPWMVILICIGVNASAGCGALIGRVNAIKNAAERLSMAEVRRLAANAERERIGRDLHDLLGHTLSLITLKLELSRKLFDRDPDTARRELAEAEKVARHALSEVRAAVTGIRATGLAGELASARLMLRASGVAFASGEMPSLPDAVDDTLALVLRESVTNIHRHAHASHASVDVHVADGHVVMTVRDDGRGGVGASGNGLQGMRERVEALGGRFTITSRMGRGTEVRVDVPLPEAPAAAARETAGGSGETLPAGVSMVEHQAGSRA